MNIRKSKAPSPKSAKIEALNPKLQRTAQPLAFGGASALRALTAGMRAGLAFSQMPETCFRATAMICWGVFL